MYDTQISNLKQLILYENMPVDLLLLSETFDQPSAAALELCTGPDKSQNVLEYFNLLPL